MTQDDGDKCLGHYDGFERFVSIQKRQVISGLHKLKI